MLGLFASTSTQKTDNKDSLDNDHAYNNANIDQMMMVASETSHGIDTHVLEAYTNLDCLRSLMVQTNTKELTSGDYTYKLGLFNGINVEVAKK